MPPVKPEPTGVRYWTSLRELAQTPELEEAVRRELPGDQWDQLPAATRRSFLKVMGASLAFAGLTSCRWPAEEILPFASRPEDRIPGVPQRFATAFELAGVALGMVVTSVDGRPVKAEGNPLHPDSRGALSAVAQASVLELYDPDRSRKLLFRSAGQEYVKSLEDLAEAAPAMLVKPGKGIAVLAESSSSPSLAATRARLLETFPEATWYEYQPVSYDNERLGLGHAYGRRLRGRPRLERARVIACFDADPFGDHPAAVRLARDFAASRYHAGNAMSRLWVGESSYTLTGVQADHRIPLPFSQVGVALAVLTQKLVRAHGLALSAAATGLMAAAAAAPAELVDDERIDALAGDLMAHRADALVLVGYRQPAAVHALAAVLNDALGAVGATIGYSELDDVDRPSHLEAIRLLADRMTRAEVQTLVVVGGNPVYDAPADLDFPRLFDEVPHTIHLSLYDSETSRRSRWHVPIAHFLESWGDGRGSDGTWTMVQPLIAPLYGSPSAVEALTLLLGDRGVKGYDLVRATMRERFGPTDFEGLWRSSLHDGVVAGSELPEVEPTLDTDGLNRAAMELARSWPEAAPAIERLEVVLGPDRKVHDGRFANNGWLQELPDALTKVTWDNVAIMSPATARELGVGDGDLVELFAAPSSVVVPAYVMPGQARNCLSLSLGYGRTAAGRVGNGVGANAFVLHRTDSPFVIAGVRARPKGGRRPLACTQDHHLIDLIGFRARNARIANLVRETTPEELARDPDAIRHQDHHPPLRSLWRERTYDGEQWGMSVDLSSCIGCNACVVACQAENNIPVVGRQQVLNQREMHWIRVDRYFKTDPTLPLEEVEDAEVVLQPVACVQCENAPCEQVCPVAATQHTEDGLNAMAYNRCVGTRYCSNNCPYKVRRFNFFNYTKGLSELTAMQRNPEVTVRSRGVMEKCTYCVQRIAAARITARNERRAIADGEVVTACQQTCPTRAIVFGNLNDPASEVARLRDDFRAYATLAELNIKPRTHYLARVRNPVAGERVSGTDHDAHGEESA